MSTQSSKALHIALWVAQALLAAAFLMIGGMKLFTPAEKMAEMAKETPVAMIRFIGVAEVLGALGLILPSLLRVMPKLTALAAVGLLTIMVLATGLHASKGESIIPTIAFGAVAAFIAWGRYSKAPIQPK